MTTTFAADKTHSTTHIGADDDQYDGGNVSWFSVNVQPAAMEC